MTRETRRRKWRWLRHVAWILGAKVFLIVTGVMIFFGSGAGNPLLSRLLVGRLEQLTGGKVELRSVSIQWLAMQATIKGVVIHGRESADHHTLYGCLHGEPLNGTIKGVVIHGRESAGTEPLPWI